MAASPIEVRIATTRYHRSRDIAVEDSCGCMEWYPKGRKMGCLMSQVGQRPARCRSGRSHSTANDVEGAAAGIARIREVTAEALVGQLTTTGALGAHTAPG